MSTLVLAVLLLGEPPAATPASPAPARPASPAPEKKRDRGLGAVAKRTPAAGKKVAPAKVLTNEDLDKARQGGAAVSVLAADGVEPAPAESSGDVVTERAARSETNWRVEAEAARTRVSDAVASVTEAEERLAALRSDLQPQDTMNPFREQARAAAIQTATEGLDAARARLAAMRQALSDLEEEARRAGVPPGWVREP